MSEPRQPRLALGKDDTPHELYTRNRAALMASLFYGEAGFPALANDATLQAARESVGQWLAELEERRELPPGCKEGWR